MPTSQGIAALAKGVGVRDRNRAVTNSAVDASYNRIQADRASNALNGARHRLARLRNIESLRQREDGINERLLGRRGSPDMPRPPSTGMRSVYGWWRYPAAINDIW
jgi:hypothetical protein